jgi:hypothetical protein
MFNRYLILLPIFLLASAVSAVAVADTSARSGEASIASPPKVQTANAYGVQGSEAVIAGFVNARGPRTIFWFQYGPTKSYGMIAPETTEDELYGNERREVEEGLDCLQPKTTYHFRIVARNRYGKAFGRDRTFTTTRLHKRIPIVYAECPKADWPGR